MSDEVLKFEEHRRRRDENASSVRCARCGKMIMATVTRCPECGVHFRGEAQEFTHGSERQAGDSQPKTWVVVVAVLLLAALLLSVVGPW